MSGPTERLSLRLLNADGPPIDFGVVVAEVEPRRGAAGMISADGELPKDSAWRETLIAHGIRANMEGMRGRLTRWRVAPAAPAVGDVLELEYECETFAFGERRFSILLSREADRAPPIARPAEGSDDGAK